MAVNGSNENTPLVRYSDPNDEELSGCGATACCDPRRSLHRYCLLIFICFLSFGSYFCYDNPAALEKKIEQDMNVTPKDYVLLYSLYSYPNVVLCFFGGFLLDKVFGVSAFANYCQYLQVLNPLDRLGTIIFSMFCLTGQIIFALGAYINSYITMEIGRFCFGLGGENLAVAQNTYAVTWFKGSELNMVFGLQLSFSRVGSTVNMNVMGPIYKSFRNHFDQGHVALGWTLFVGAALCLFSLLCGVFLGYFDKRAEKILRRGEGNTGDVIRLRDVKDFPLTLWLIFIICVTYYVAVFPFISLGLAFFQAKFDLSPGEAGAVNSIVYIISAAASPVLGLMVDKVGKNVFWVLLAVFLTLCCHIMLALTFWPPFLSMSIMGVAYSLLACALWPLVALVVPEHQLGTAYGFMQSIQNLGLAVIIEVAGIVVEKFGYLYLEVFFCAWLCLALVASVLLYLADASKGGSLNLSTAERKRMATEARATLLASEEDDQARRQSEYGVSPIKPRTQSQLRLRYLARVGQQYFQLTPGTYRSSAFANPHLLK